MGLQIRNVTVIGANGSMGRNIAGIFASFGNARVYLVCRSKEKAEEARRSAALSVKAEAIEKNLIPCEDTELEDCVAQSDLIFESVVEDMQVKKKLNARISSAAKPDAIICTGTSGLSIEELSKTLRDVHRSRFLGMHLFNPPYNLTLCELIASSVTDRQMFLELKDYAQKVLLRTVVEIKDAPAFLGNRIGFYLINDAMQQAEKYRDKGGIDYIDSIMGQYTGRGMAPLNTADFVGLDVHKAIVENVYANTNDYAHDQFRLPEFVGTLIERNWLGRKNGRGFYKARVLDNGKKAFEVYDLNEDNFRDSKRYQFAFKEKMIAALLVGDYRAACKALVQDDSPEAMLCKEFMLKYIAYSLYCAQLVGQEAHDADKVMVTGFGWAPPLGMIQFLGGNTAVKRMFREYFSDTFCNATQIERLLDLAPVSQYDYRRFFRAKQ